MTRAKPVTVARLPPPNRFPLDVELLAIDPGIRHPAAARFSGGKLIGAARTPVRADWTGLDMGQRCLNVARAMVQWEHDVPPSHAPITHVMIEYPQIYPEERDKNPNNLTPLVGVAMAVVGLLAAHNPALKVIAALPREIWDRLPKHETGDPWASPRGNRIASRLDDAERATIVASHDAIDAVGIGLWVLGRFERRRVFPGAT